MHKDQPIHEMKHDLAIKLNELKHGKLTPHGKKYLKKYAKQHPNGKIAKLINSKL